MIDIQSQADRDYKFIMVYQNQLSKFVQLRPLKSKRAEEVSYQLVDILFLEHLAILQSVNGREISNNSVVEEVCTMWPELKVIHGKPRHSQSQRSVKRANQDIEKMLFTWLESNNTTKWSEELHFIKKQCLVAKLTRN